MQPGEIGPGSSSGLLHVPHSRTHPREAESVKGLFFLVAEVDANGSREAWNQSVVILAHVLLVEASHMAKSNIGGAGKS